MFSMTPGFTLPPADFHIVHVVHPTAHGPLGYREVIDTLQWGLTQLGHKVSTAANTVSSDRINIFLGGQMLSPAQVQGMPPGSIFYQLEQIARAPADKLRLSLPAIAARFQIWDYNQANIDSLQQLSPAFPPRLLPISFSPNLQRIQRLADEDIDILFYGIPTPNRLAVFDQLCQSNLRCVYACGLYGPARDSLIARSRIVLNLNAYEFSRVFEIVRVSYLLANEKAVVSDIYPDSIIDPDLRDAVAFAPLEKIERQCIALLGDPSARQALAARGRAIFEKRDIRANLERVLNPG
jgi:hypothetical protein